MLLQPNKLRLYTLPDFDQTAGSPTVWRGLQVFLVEGGNATPVTRPLFFPNRVIVSESSEVSPLLQNSASGLGAEVTPTAPVGAFASANVRYKSFTMRPNGTVTASNNIPSENWFLTLHHENDPKPDGLKPANFATIQINPITGKVTLLRT